MSLARMVARPFTVALLGLLCLGIYPVFLQIPESAPFLRSRQGMTQPHSRTRQEATGRLPARTAATRVDGAVPRPGGQVGEAARAGAPLVNEQAEAGTGTEGGLPPVHGLDGGGGGAAGGSVRPSSARRRRGKDAGIVKQKGKAHQPDPEDKTPRTPGGSIDEEDYGDMDAEELEDLRREKEAERKEDHCRCAGGQPLECDLSNMNNRAVASVCSFRDDVKDLYRLHKWRLQLRMNVSLPERFGFHEAEAANGTNAAGPPAQAVAAAEVAGEVNVGDSLDPKPPAGKARPDFFPPGRSRPKVPSLAKQKAKMAEKLVKDKVFRNKLIRKMRDSYGRRFLLPKPFDDFNDMLVDPQEFVDRDEEDAYIAVLSASVLANIRDTLSSSNNEFMKPENMFYALDNQDKLRSKHDYFRNDSIRLLPEHAPKLKYKSCAVVGNSGALKDDSLGPVIDLHDLIIRTNQAPTWKYEPFVGSTTHMRIINKRWSDELARRHIKLLAHDADNVTIVATRANIREFTMLGRELQKAKPHARLLFLTSRVITGALRFLRMFRKGAHMGMPRAIRGGNTASSGFLAIFLALQWCDRVHAYGFSLEECRSAGCSRDYHYFKGIADSPWLRAHPSHSFELEGMVLKAMHVLGIVCLFPNPSLVGLCGGRLGGLIDEGGRWQEGVDLGRAMSTLGVRSAATLKEDIREFKERRAAERADADVRALGEALEDAAAEGSEGAAER